MEQNGVWYWLALKAVPRLAVHKKLALVEQVGLKQLFELAPPSLKALGLTLPQQQAILHPDESKINQVIEQANDCCCILTYDNDEYPERLKQIYDPPLVLFYQGDVELLKSNAVALVGSRHSSDFGRETASTFAYELVQQNVTVTSGLALGIDGAAHKGALNANGNTIAVVATGLDSVYPARHRALAKEIMSSKGLIISEFAPGTPPRAGNFPKRNRLISGLSLGVVVVEAAIKSGSLITARCALEQNREVFAVPSAINNPAAKGCHHLIKEGAKLIESAADILEELDLPLLSGHINQTEEKVEESCQQSLFIDPLLASVGYEITPVDQVISRSKLPTDEVLTRLTMLELRGLVAAVPGGYLRLNRG